MRYEPPLTTRLRWFLGIIVAIAVVILVVVSTNADAESSRRESQERRETCYAPKMRGKIESAVFRTDLAYGYIKAGFCVFLPGTRVGHMYATRPFRAWGKVTGAGEASYWSGGKVLRKNHECVRRRDRACKRYKWTATFRFKQDFPGPAPTNRERMKVKMRCNTKPVCVVTDNA